MKLPFNQTLVLGSEIENIQKAIDAKKLSGDGEFNKKCSFWFEKNIGSKLAIPTPSCTAALEMALMLIDLKPGDEVILPSFTFTSTATSIVLHGGIPVFIDSREDNFNLDEGLIEDAITKKTRAIVPVHYGGISCDMHVINNIADKYNLIVIEDAAQCIGAYYDGDPVGSQGHMSAFSFHETKNINCGEGGMLCINDSNLVSRAEIIRDKGTNRSQFFRGDVDKYSWQDKGSSYLISELQAAYLFSQLEEVKKITKDRRATWEFYHQNLEELEKKKILRRPIVSSNSQHNAHLYPILLESEEKSTFFQEQLKLKGIVTAPHYVPLHSSIGGKKFGRVGSNMQRVDDFSKRLLRLPLYYGLETEQKEFVVDSIVSLI